MIYEAVAGCVTEVFHASSDPRNATRSVHFVLAPGNPGCLAFYIPLLQYMFQEVEKSVDGSTLVGCHGCGNANHHFRDEHDNDNINFEKEYTFEEQIEHFESFVMMILARDRSLYGIEDIRLIICGHSIGAYVGIEVLSRNEDLRKHCVALHILMPFIWWSNLDFLQKTKLRLYMNTPEIITRWFASRVYNMQSRVDTHTKIAFIKGTHPDMDADAVNVTATMMLSKRLLGNFFSMANTELQAVICNEKQVVQRLQKFSGLMSVFALYTDNDVWAPEKDIARLSKFCPYVNTKFIPGLTHAFATSLGKSAVVGNAMLEDLRKNCRGLKSLGRAQNKLVSKL